MGTRTVNNVVVDDVWNDPETRDQPGALEIQRNMYVQRPGYRMWTLIDALASGAMILLPGVGGVLGFTGVLDVYGVSTLAVIAALVVGIVYKYQPATEAACYQAAVQYNQAARILYESGNEEGAGQVLLGAILLTTPRAPTTDPVTPLSSAE